MARRELVSRIARTVRGDAPEPPSSGLPTVAEAIQLIYPPTVAADVLAALEDDNRRLVDLSELRRLMAPFDRQTFPSAVHINFGQEDIAEQIVEGVRLVLDTADTSVSRTLLDTLVYEPHVTNMFRRYITPGMTVVDVGANVGYFSALASSLVGPQGRVIALEPNSENCRLILLTMLANQSENVELLPVAASDRRGWQYFSAHVGSNGGFIGSTGDDLRDGRGTVVPSFALDDLVHGAVHFLKLDVEGAEGLVLAGAEKLLELNRPIVVSELSIEMLERVSGGSVRAYVKSFVDRGYSVHVLNPDSSTSKEVIDVARFLGDWTDIFRLEELLFLPDGGASPVS